MADWQLNTPVAFLIFNRPDTTERVFEAIRAARPPMLLVVADGPRPGRQGEAELCQATRGIIDRVDWPCQVMTDFSDQNLGCKKRISSGLDWVFSKVEEAIILEDDCLPHPTFFRFCEEMLVRYRQDERVMMITGTNFLVDKLDIRESYCFSRYFAIWGWATWKRAWDKYDLAMSGWEAYREQDQLKSFYTQNFMRKHLSKAFDAVFRGEIDTWDYQWAYTCLFNNGLSIVPSLNMISNIGYVGVHTKARTRNHDLPVFAIELDQMIHPVHVMPNRLHDDPFFEMGFNKSLASRIRKFFSKLFNYDSCR